MIVAGRSRQTIEAYRFPKLSHALVPNTYAFETQPLVKPTGFREYDARWLFGKEINLMGVQALGLGLATLIHEMGRRGSKKGLATLCIGGGMGVAMCLERA